MDQMGFYEVFPNMNAESDLSNALSDATVTKVSTGRSKDDIRIYVTFNTLIPKRRIWNLEKSIKKQFFSIRLKVMLYEPNKKEKFKMMRRGFKDAKANKLRLNLIQDQIIHFIQILITFFIIM